MQKEGVLISVNAQVCSSVMCKCSKTSLKMQVIHQWSILQFTLVLSLNIVRNKRKAVISFELDLSGYEYGYSLLLCKDSSLNHEIDTRDELLSWLSKQKTFYCVCVCIHTYEQNIISKRPVISAYSGKCCCILCCCMADLCKPIGVGHADSLVSDVV